MAVIDPPVPGSPQWWLLRLLRRLEARAPSLRTWQDYYEGQQPLAFASDKFREAFGDRFPAFTSNFCELVVEGSAERLEVQGFRFSDPAGDRDVWAMWQDNDLDGGSQLAHVESLIKGTSYGLVEPRAAGENPVITIEDALDTIVESDPKDRRSRRAGLKRWVDDAGQLVVVVYLPQGVYKYRTTARWGKDYTGWDWGLPALEPGEWTEGTLRLWGAAGFTPYMGPEDDEWPLPNPLGVVPLVELPNRPRLRSGGRSEVKSIRSNQDAVNKYRTDALIASEFAAFPQRYLLNYEALVDEDTGRAKEPFRAAIDRLWTVPPPDPELEGAPEPKFGQFAAADLAPYQSMIGLEVGHISSISRIPYHYLLGTPQSVPPSGESLKSSEAGLEHKTHRAQLFLGEGWEELMRTGLLAKGDPRASNRHGETIWQDTETRNEAVRTDAIVKLHAEGLIDEELAWELQGLTPGQMSRLRARRPAPTAATMGELEERLVALLPSSSAEATIAAVRAAVAALEPPAPAGPPGGQAPELVPAPTGPRMG